MVGTHDFSVAFVNGLQILQASNNNKKAAAKKEIPAKSAGVKKSAVNKKGKNVSNGADEIDDIFSKKKITDASEIDDIFNTKSIKGDTAEKEPALSKSAKRKAAKKSKQSGEKQADNDEENEDEEEEEQEELTEEQSKKVEEVVFAELAAVKSSNPSKKRAAPPPVIDDAFGDSRGIKKTNRTTEDGYPLYDVKDLNIGGGLDTPECPFDCQCCF
ncbi:hypothetical protein MUCCIDRAFT_165149 [Mucor lusitanicus CBS 277.49]|uniref:DUF1764-domain-containing protein n=1 Tax=Mucor lusitanicus CBS 277.49 TaxID=747725 RepID=A0A168JIU3_MUCCL|nr:hypothetical protein MUCCIDRAFT_165149 [Mucor lusitanicus CBS 277.49]